MQQRQLCLPDQQPVWRQAAREARCSVRHGRAVLAPGHERPEEGKRSLLGLSPHILLRPGSPRPAPTAGAHQVAKLWLSSLAARAVGDRPLIPMKDWLPDPMFLKRTPPAAGNGVGRADHAGDRAQAQARGSCQPAAEGCAAAGRVRLPVATSSTVRSPLTVNGIQGRVRVSSRKAFNGGYPWNPMCGCQFPPHSESLRA